MSSRRPQHISARAPSTIVMVASSRLVAGGAGAAGEVVSSSDELPDCQRQVWVFLSTGWSGWEARWAFQGGGSSISGFSICVDFVEAELQLTQTWGGGVLFSKYPCQPSLPLVDLISQYCPSFLCFSWAAALLLFSERARHPPVSGALHMPFLLPEAFPLDYYPPTSRAYLSFFSQALPQTSPSQKDIPLLPF